MTANELTNYLFNSWVPIDRQNATYEVDHETFANVCQAIFDMKAPKGATSQRIIQIAIGKNNGIMFKGVEIILKKEKT